MYWSYSTKQQFQILILVLAIPCNCIWHWIRTSQCADLMSISLQAIIRRWIWWLKPACIHLFSAIAQNHHPPSCNRIKLFVCMCHSRHSKDRETADKLLYWWHLTYEWSISEFLFCDADVMFLFCIFGGKLRIAENLRWWMTWNNIRILLYMLNVLMVGKAAVSKYLCCRKMALATDLLYTLLDC